MGFKNLDNLTSEETKANAEHAKKQREADAASLAQLFSRLFSTEDGVKVLTHLSDKCLVNNPTPISSPNINYEAAYKNGEGGVIRYIITQINNAKVI